MELIAELQPRTARPQPVCLRIAVDNTRLMAEDPELAKADWLGKFGMDPPDALAAAEIALEHPGLELAGLHNHLGFSAYGTPYSPQLDVVRHERCVEQTLEVAKEIREQHGHRLAILNMGGGYRVGNPHGYGPGRLTEFPSAADYAMAIGGTAKELCRGVGSRDAAADPRGGRLSRRPTRSRCWRASASGRRAAPAARPASGRRSRTRPRTTSCAA